MRPIRPCPTPPCIFRKPSLRFVDDSRLQVPQLSLDLTDTRHQLVAVTLRFTPRFNTAGVQLPAWTPGSYLIRDYVSRLEGFQAIQRSTPCKFQRSGVANWQLQVDPGEPVELHYRILARECTVRTAHLSQDHAFLPLAAVALEVDGERWTPWQLRLRLPEFWQAFLPLPLSPCGAWQADHFDALVDAPLEAGPHASHPFTVGAAEHTWVGWGADLPSEDPRWLSDVADVCQACCRLMGEAQPAAPTYLFILHLLEQGYGGLEHDHSSVLLFGRRALATPKGRRELLQLVAHEYLHQWNVRRLRPAELTPVAYGHPTIVPTLWFAEGVTSYYDQLLLVIAGLSDEATYLESLEADLSRYLCTPGRSVQSLRLSSEEAWVKLYRQDSAAPDQQISYYLKGAVLALVLDLHLRRSGACLAKVLQGLWARFGRHGRGYREQDLLVAFAEQSTDLAVLLPSWLNSLDDPPLQDYLADVGLRLEPELAAIPATGLVFEAAPSTAVSPGASNGSSVIRRVRRCSPAAAAQLHPGDELLAVDDHRVRSPESLLQLWREGCSHQVLFCRDGRIRQTMLTPTAPDPERWRLLPQPDASPQQLSARRRWLEVVA